jgi:hypothetical protein
LKEVRGQIQVLIKWIGFDEAENTWEPVTTVLEDAPDFLEVSSSALASQVHEMLSKPLCFWGGVHSALSCWTLALRIQSLILKIVIKKSLTSINCVDMAAGCATETS